MSMDADRALPLITKFSLIQYSLILIISIFPPLEHEAKNIPWIYNFDFLIQQKRGIKMSPRFRVFEKAEELGV